MVDGMRSISTSDEEHNYFIKICLDRLQLNCGQYPRFAAQAASKLAPLLGQEYWRIDTFPHPGWETPYWRAASLDVAAAALTPPNRDQYFLCDNITVCIGDYVGNTVVDA
jgi:hypothetical protein